MRAAHPKINISGWRPAHCPTHRSEPLAAIGFIKCERVWPDTPVEEDVGEPMSSLTPADVRNVAFSKAPIDAPGYHRTRWTAFSTLRKPPWAAEVPFGETHRRTASVRTGVPHLDSNLRAVPASDAGQVASDTPVTQCLPSRAFCVPAPVSDEASPFPSSLKARTPRHHRRCSSTFPCLLYTRPGCAPSDVLEQSERSDFECHPATSALRKSAFYRR